MIEIVYSSLHKSTAQYNPFPSRIIFFCTELIRSIKFSVVPLYLAFDIFFSCLELELTHWHLPIFLRSSAGQLKGMYCPGVSYWRRCEATEQLSKQCVLWERKINQQKTQTLIVKLKIPPSIFSILKIFMSSGKIKVIFLLFKSNNVVPK